MIWPAKRITGLPLESASLRLRLPVKSDFNSWHQLRQKNRDFLTPFEPKWSKLDLTAKNFNTKVKACVQAAKKREEFSFLIFALQQEKEILLGGITLSNIRYRAARQANLGYWLGAQYTGKGFMSQAVALVLDFSFASLKLNRINAICLPHNHPSIKVLEAKNFAKEGMAEQFLCINGKFRDHLLYGLTHERYVSFLRK